MRWVMCVFGVHSWRSDRIWLFGVCRWCANPSPFPQPDQVESWC